ncbi:hypothetical protein MCEMAEM21_00764 [Oxalobacteraceae bacterium]
MYKRLLQTDNYRFVSLQTYLAELSCSVFYWKIHKVKSVSFLFRLLLISPSPTLQ